MQTKNLIQASAKIIQITSIEKGNVVKLIVEDSYSSATVKYAVVIDLINNGSKTFIELLEYSKTYGEIRPEIKIYDGSKDLNMFPTDLEEVKIFFNETLESVQRTIEERRKELRKLEDGFKKASEFATGELSKQLTNVSFQEIKSEVKTQETTLEINT